MTKPNLQPSAESLEPAFNDANCKKLGMDALKIMYPEDGDERAEAIAKAVCDNCVAFEPCKERGKHEPHGVWAGQTVTERHRERKNVRNEQRRMRRGRTAT